jgi:hypothetical protein
MPNFVFCNGGDLFFGGLVAGQVPADNLIEIGYDPAN